MTEQTLVLIKPDAMERDLSDEIIEIYKENGLKIKNQELSMQMKKQLNNTILN